MYQIALRTKQKAKEIGVEVKPSSLKNKKLDVFRKGRKIASIGDTRYKDYASYLKSDGKVVADDRRRLYHARHTANTEKSKLSKKLLW